MKRRAFLKLAASTPLLVQANTMFRPKKAAGAERRHPNVILMSIDCLNQRQFQEAMEGSYSPAMSSLKKDSMAFLRNYSHAPWTTPSHMSMITGLMPSQHGRTTIYNLQANYNPYYDRVPIYKTLADILSEEGYETVAFVGCGSISGRYGFIQGFQRFNESVKNEAHSDLPATLAAFENWMKHRDKNKPFFLFFHTYDFHHPLPNGLANISESDKPCLEYINKYLEQFFTALKKSGEYDPSLIFFTGDHGSRMIHTEGKCCSHGSGHYEENLKVPMLLKLPGNSLKGDNSLLARHIDIFPTVVDVLGLSKDSYPGLGISLLSRFSKRSGQNTPLASFSEADAYCNIRFGLVNEEFNYIYAPKNEYALLALNFDGFSGWGFCNNAPCNEQHIEEFYDLKTDPFEDNDLLAGKKKPEELSDMLDAFRTELTRYLNLPRFYVANVVTKPARVSKTDHQEHLKVLKQLGYIQ